MPKWVNCTGDVVTGDTIRFTEAVWGGSYRRPVKLGERTVTARVTADSYGIDKQQHTFSLEVIEADGHDAPPAGKKIRRKGRNIYRNGTKRLVWDNESARKSAADEKHRRGDHARAAREDRISFGY
ncbi:MAG: hypothetical protein ACE5FS_03470 [Paracoccaceae bacterium]